MGETFFNGIPVIRVEGKHLRKKIKTQARSTRKQRLPVLFGSFGEGFYEVQSLFITDVTDVIVVWCSEDRYDSLNLIQIILSWEKSCPAEKFSKNAANRPYINRFRIFRGVEDDFRRSVPSSDDIPNKSTQSSSRLRFHNPDLNPNRKSLHHRLC